MYIDDLLKALCEGKKIRKDNWEPTHYYEMKDGRIVDHTGNSVDILFNDLRHKDWIIFEPLNIVDAMIALFKWDSILDIKTNLIYTLEDNNLWIYKCNHRGDGIKYAMLCDVSDIEYWNNLKNGLFVLFKGALYEK